MINEDLLERYSNLSVDEYKDLLAEVKQLREQQKKILEIAETNMLLEWGATDIAFEWRYIINMIKGYCTEIWEEEE
tara:strand:+ start:567 stop:794 length:228 start_codon:yes stop_codon:yes gene_type:complete